MRLPVGTWRLPPRNAEFVSLLETFLITAVATILVIRTQLWLTNYPQLGGGGLHIAHLLWGGLFMMIAIGILLSFLGRSARRPAALIGGVGFGFFIDELGKFITSDNNYFFRPAAGVIYAVFILLFLLVEQLRRRGSSLTAQERAANAMYIAISAVHGRLGERDRRRAIALLDDADAADPLVRAVREQMAALQAGPAPEPRLYERWGRGIRDTYLRVVLRPAFRWVLTAIFCLWAGTYVVVALGYLVAAGAKISGVRGVPVDDLDFLHVASTVTSTVSALFILIGVLALWRGRRITAYINLERGLLVSIFLTHVFTFVESQFAAVFGLGLDVLLLVTVRALREAEESREPLIDTAAPDEAAPTVLPSGASLA